MAKRELTPGERAFMKSIWILVLCMLFGGAATLYFDDGTWIRYGCLGGVLVWLLVGFRSERAAKRHAATEERG